MNSLEGVPHFPAARAARPRCGSRPSSPAASFADHDELDETPLLTGSSARAAGGVVEKLWMPLLDSKFDGRYDDLPATYIWARTRRMSAHARPQRAAR